MAAILILRAPANGSLEGVSEWLDFLAEKKPKAITGSKPSQPVISEFESKTVSLMNLAILYKLGDKQATKDIKEIREGRNTEDYIINLLVPNIGLVLHECGQFEGFQLMREMKKM